MTAVLVTGGALVGDAAPPVDERSLPKPTVHVRGVPRLTAFPN
jgi:hypothetical protein